MKKFCIYFKKTEPIVNFKSGEHIFPAGVGGIQKLPNEFVSHEANNYFSSMEGKVMRNSLLALPRQFVGPGKRGNLTNLNKATKSNISIINSIDNPNVIELGYVSLGKPYIISQIKLNLDGKGQFISGEPCDNIQLIKENFISKLRKYKGVFTIIEDKRFSPNEFIFGVYSDKYYVGLSNKNLVKEIDVFVEKIVNQNIFDDTNPEHREVRIKVEQILEFDDSYFRVCAKVIFNYVAFIKGQDFILHNCFDPIRNWILNGGKNKFARLTGKETKFNSLKFPDQAHKLFIVKKGNSLVGVITFYGNGFETIVELSNNFEGEFYFEGFICDWKNRKEYKFQDYVNSEID